MLFIVFLTLFSFMVYYSKEGLAILAMVARLVNLTIV